MKTKTKPFSLSSLNGLREKTNTRSDYQRPEVWKKIQKQLLIDSILRDYDIPKIYVKQEDAASQYEFEVIDGQQRLVAIWEYFDNEFGLPKNAEPIDEINCASQGYESLNMDLRTKFNDYLIDVTIVTEAIQTDEKDEIGELFLRLQNGTPLNGQEKRNAMPGNMRDFVKELAKHDFFKSCNFTNIRYAYDAMAAQLICLELSLGNTDRPCNINTGELDKMYRKQKDFDMNGKTAKQVKRTLDYLQKAFPGKTPELLNYNIFTLYCLASKLIKFYAYDGTEPQLYKWFMSFEDERRKNDALDDNDNQKDAILAGYSAISSNTGDKPHNVAKRLALMKERFFLSAPDIEKK